MIKRQRKVAVDPSVKDVYRQVCDSQLRDIYARLSSMSRDQQKRFLDRERYNIGRLRSIMRDNGPGVGMDLAITRLRAVDLAEISTAEVGGELWLYGRTWAPFEIEVVRHDLVGRRRRARYVYNVEEKAVCPHGYHIWFPVSAIGKTNLSRVGFIPVFDQYLCDRHMHQYVHPIHGYIEVNPVLAEPNTCWSEFGSPISSAMQAADLPGLFQLLRKFVGRFYPGSPLVHMEHLVSNGVIA